MYRIDTVAKIRSDEEKSVKKGTQTDTVGKRKFGILDSAAYAAGDFGCNMSFALKGTLGIFWTQFMGLDLLYPLLLVLVQIWDAINDPVIGALIDIDRRHYRRGKLLAYVNLGSIGLLVAGAFCFIPIPRAPTWGKILVFIVGYIIWDAFYTVANVPYGALLSRISPHPADRASLSAWRSIGSTVGNMLPVAILPFLIYDESDNLIGERVFTVALMMGLLGFLAFRFMIRKTVIRVPSPPESPQNRPTFSIRKAFSGFLHNRPAVGATVAAMGMFLGMKGGELAVIVLFQSYFHNVQVSGLIQVFAMIPILAFTPLARRAVVRYGKKELATVGSLCSIAACILMLFLPIPPNNLGMTVYVLCQLLNSLGIGIYSTVSWAMMGDAVDYGEWKNGSRDEGIVYSLHSFFRKLAQGIGPALVLVIMTALGYVGTNEGNQTAAVALRMRYLVAALYLFSAVIQLLGLTVIYNLNKKKLSEMNTALTKRRGAAGDGKSHEHLQ